MADKLKNKINKKINNLNVKCGKVQGKDDALFDTECLTCLMPSRRNCNKTCSIGKRRRRLNKTLFKLRVKRQNLYERLHKVILDEQA